MTERTTLLNKAKMVYKAKLEEGSTIQPFLSGVSESYPTNTNDEVLPQGWALKISKEKSRFNDNPKKYLNDKFRLGQETGVKANPAQVSTDMRRAKNSNGKRRFKMEEFLTQKQIQSYFSRVSAKIKHGDLDLNEIEIEAIEEEIAFSTTRNVIITECQLTHPIVYDTYNICEMYSKDTLKKLSVALLRTEKESTLHHFNFTTC